MKRIFGEIENIKPGKPFKDRKELHESGIHRSADAGICGGARDGAESIVLSGGYEDDEDYGDVIIYTGHGGRDRNTAKQIADQELARGNSALVVSKNEGFPIRVTRSCKNPGNFSPSEGFQYAGLYLVEDYWFEKGKSGFKVWRFRLSAIDAKVRGISKSNNISLLKGEGDIPAKRKEVLVQRIVRDFKLAKKVKELYNYECQVCGVKIPTGPSLYYAEAAHIKPLGNPHNGPDLEANLLCLCPNHHVMFDNGCFTIADDFNLIGQQGKLRKHKKHTIAVEFIQYHREYYYKV